MGKEVRTYNGVKTVYLIKDVAKPEPMHVKKINLAYLLTPFTSINSNSIKDLNVRLKTIKLLEENIDNIILDVFLSNFFLIYVLGQEK